MTNFKDVTLREGSQVPGLRISESQGKEVLASLAELDIGRVEVSFPRAWERIAWYRHAEKLGLRTAALARAVPDDVDSALSVDPDEIEVIITSSDIQLEYALGKSRDEARASLTENVERVLDGGVDAGVTLMDAIRADNDYLVTIARAAVDAGAKHVTLADTTGAGIPEVVHETVTAVTDEISGEATVGIHTHDDMDVATANAVAGVAAGATSVDATIGGIGERAGNAPLEAVAVLLAEQDDDPALTLDTLVPVCRQIHETLGVTIPPEKSIIGERAYRHESGMHTAAMLDEPSTYEPFTPASYGGQRELLFGGETGRGAVRALLADAGQEPTDEAVTETLSAIKDAATETDEPLSEDEVRQLVRSDR
jgi:isopropylmalate/homocitrate/citramalate synthase